MVNMLPSMLRWLREREELTQKEVAERMGVGRTTYASWESGIKKPGPEGIARCAEFFHVSTDDLIFGIERRGMQ